jgi:hypothetical protein
VAVADDVGAAGGGEGEIGAATDDPYSRRVLEQVADLPIAARFFLPVTQRGLEKVFHGRVQTHACRLSEGLIRNPDQNPAGLRIAQSGDHTLRALVGGQPLCRDTSQLMRVAGAAQTDGDVRPLHPAALEIGDASDCFITAMHEQRALEKRGGELHLGKGAGPHRLFVDGNGEGKGLGLPHGDQEAIAGLGARRVVDQDLAKLGPAPVEHASLLSRDRSRWRPLRSPS